MKINALLTERAIVQEQILTDSTYREFHALGKMLMLEYDMDQKQVRKVFYSVAQGAEQGGNVDNVGDEPVSNRTLIGKGADAASAVAEKYRGLKQYIGKTGPVKGLDAMIDSVQRQITQAAGGEAGKLSQTIEFYRELSKVPGLALAVKFLIVSTAGLLAAGTPYIAIAAGLTFANKMLQGDKFSSAVIGAMETGGTVAAIQTAKDLLTTTHVGADYGNADDQSFGEIPRTDPNDLSNIDPNNIYRPTPTTPGAAPYSDAANAAYTQNPDPSTGLPLDPNTRADYTTPDTAPGADDVAPTTTEYKVTAADSKLGVGGIAQKYPGISAQDIIDYNNLPPDGLIKPGQVLQIPDPNVVSPASTNVWDRYAGPTNTPQDMDAVSDRANNIFKAQDAADAEYYSNKPDDFGVPARSNDAVGDGMPKAQPVMPGTPSDGSYKQVAPTFNGQPMRQMPMDDEIPSTGSAYLDRLNRAASNGVKLREYAEFVTVKSMKSTWIDVDTTARMWILQEAVGKTRRSIYLTNEGVKAVFHEVALRSALTEGPMLDKLKGFNKWASAGINKVATPIKQTLRRGAESMTNKITFRDLMLNWQRSAKLDKQPSVDSMDVVDFLKDQGVKAPLINASFKALGLQEPTLTGATPAAQGDGAAAGFAQGLLGANGAQVANAINAYQKTQGGVPKRGAAPAATPTQATTPAATPTQATTPAATPTAEPTATTTPASQKPAATTKPSTGYNLPQATSTTAGQPSKVTYDPKMFAKKAAAPNFNALSTAASKGYKTAQPTSTVPTVKTAPATTTTQPKTTVTTGGPTPDERANLEKRIQQMQQRQAQTQTAPVAESRVDFGAMLFNRMKNQS